MSPRTLLRSLRLPPLLAAALLASACGDDAAAPSAPAAPDLPAPASPDGGGPEDADDAAEAPDAPDAARTVAVTFVVTIPRETPAAAAVSVALEAPEAAVLLDCGAATSRCTATTTLPAGATRAFSIRLSDGRTARNLDGTARPPEPLALPAGAAGAASPTLTAEVSVARWGDPSAPAAGPAVAFLVDPGPATPPHEALFVSGSIPGLGGWDGRGLRLEPGRDGALVGLLEDASGGPDFAFKLTRGSWYTVEKGASGAEIQNRVGRFDGTRLVRIDARPDGWADLLPPDTGTLTGDVRRWQAVTSAFLAAPRDLLVWLPPGYGADPTRRYPVLYAHDGQNLMDAETAFGGFEWGLDETLSALVAAGAIPPVIAIAVGNTSDRIDEYTPTASLDYGGGGLPDYARFLVEELKPMIDDHFRTLRGREDTAVMGSSLGGLASLWLGLVHADTFGRLGVVSPSIWWDGRAILGTVSRHEGPRAAHLWVDIGTDEGDGEALGDTRALRDALVSRGWREGGDLTYREYEGAGHNEAAWADRLPDILGALLAP